MKKAKRMQRKPIAAPKLPVFDEAHLLFGEAHRAALHRDRKPDAGPIVTQAVMKFNSGKRVRFIVSVKRADGSPLKATPKKFFPAQVMRRNAA